MIRRLFIAFTLYLSLGQAEAATQYFTEPSGSVRFEQYTSGTLALWRMPSPGISVFPGGSCKSLTIPGDAATTNRWFSLYLFLKANGGNYFMYYDTSTCNVVSFGIDG